MPSQTLVITNVPGYRSLTMSLFLTQYLALRARKTMQQTLATYQCSKVPGSFSPRWSRRAPGHELTVDEYMADHLIKRVVSGAHVGNQAQCLLEWATDKCFWDLRVGELSWKPNLGHLHRAVDALPTLLLLLPNRCHMSDSGAIPAQWCHR